MVDYYSTLNVDAGAETEVIQQAIHERMRLWSNRTNAADLNRRQEAERMVKLLDEAEDILLDPEKRQQYDRERRANGSTTATIDDGQLEGASSLVEEGWRLLIEDRVADALYVATRATEADGSDAGAWALLAQAKYRWGDLQDSIYEYKRAIKLRPNDPALYFDLGAVYETAEQYRDAMTQYERAAKIDPGATMYRAAIASIFIKNDQCGEATRILEECVAEEPKNESYQWLLAAAYLDAICDGWTFVPEGERLSSGWYPTEKSHIDAANTILERVGELEFDDPELIRHFEDRKQNVEQAKRKSFVGDKVVIAFAILLGLITSPTIVGPIYFLGGAVGYVFAARPPGYVINRRILTNREINVSRIVAALFLPFIAVHEYYRNFVKEA